MIEAPTTAPARPTPGSRGSLDRPCRTRLGARLAAAAVFGVLPACTDALIPEPPDEVTVVRPAEAEECESCHPRQYAEWVGSSHNYGGGLDPTYQALEIGANYYQFALNAGRVRDNLLCISCHAPSAAAYLDGFSNTNTQYRGFQADEVRREIARSDEGGQTDALLAPAAIETEEQMPADIMALMQEDPILAGRQLRTQRRITYQGITCDTCHKVGRPLDDLQDEDVAGLIRREAETTTDPALASQLNALADRALTACVGPTRECAAVLREHCVLNPGEPRCRRIARNATYDGEDYVDIGASNLAHVYERESDIRYGQFAQGDAATNIAHGVGTAATPFYEAVDMAFPGQAPDVRPYLQTGLFCGGCHDVRLPPLPMDPSRPENRDASSADFNPRMEPVYNEPFIRLENLYTEWFNSPLNLHPDAEPRDNPYLDESGDPKRVVCQDCHMSLYPYAPPGTYPGSYTASAEDCDETGTCGETIALGTDSETGERVTRANLRVQLRERVTTHNLTGVDEGMGFIPPTPDRLGYERADELPDSLTLPNQRAEGDPSPVGQQEGRRPVTDDGRDEDYDLPLALSDRRKRLIETAATISLAGTPDVVDPADRDCFDDNGLCCDDDGLCNVPVKVWGTNVNGGHNVAAGFSQERQMWVQLTVQDMGRVDENGNNPVVDCKYSGLEDFYQTVGTRDGRYPMFSDPIPHDALSANDVFNKMYGTPDDQVRNSAFHPDHADICRGMSGHLLDKPHAETLELTADGRLDDEDVFLHRIGNTIPETYDPANPGQPARFMESWHILDLGVDAGSLGGVVDAARGARRDQFHIPGNDAFMCELSRNGNNAGLVDLPVTLIDPITGAGTSQSLGSAGLKRFRVTDTSDERYEILYPFPEYREFMPYIQPDGSLHYGERFGLTYYTNIFYSVCGCDARNGTCVGPETVTLPPYQGKPGVTMEAQVPWSLAFPSVPHTDAASDGEGDDVYHFPGFSDTRVDEYFAPFMEALARQDRELAIEPSVHGGREVYRSVASRVFTFVPLNSNHMPNNRALKMYQPLRQYYDIRVPTRGDDAVIGPLRVSAKLYFRHFPPEFLRLMERISRGAYGRAEAQGKADEYFPHGPLIVEGAEATARWPDTGNVDQLDLVLVDEAVAYIDVPTERERPAAAQALVEVPEAPTWADDVRFVMEDNCVPCHSDVLRHGQLVLSYDDFPEWDDPATGEKRHAHQDPRQNLVGVPSAFVPDETLVVPGDPQASFLYRTLVEAEPHERVRRMPVETDPLSDRELAIIRNWIRSGAN